MDFRNLHLFLCAKYLNAVFFTCEYIYSDTSLCSEGVKSTPVFCRLEKEVSLQLHCSIGVLLQSI